MNSNEIREKISLPADSVKLLKDNALTPGCLNDQA